MNHYAWPLMSLLFLHSFYLLSTTSDTQGGKNMKKISPCLIEINFQPGEANYRQILDNISGFDRYCCLIGF
jgi:hypothetical protein